MVVGLDHEPSLEECTSKDMKTYTIINGTSYDLRTPNEVIRVWNCPTNRIRLHISLGDTATGLDWLEENDVCGYVGRSMGPIKVPLLIANRRSLGGGAILDHCIVRIRESAGGRVVPASRLTLRHHSDASEGPAGRTAGWSLAGGGRSS